MLRKEEHILNEMKEKVSEFQLDVGSSVWDAIEEQIDDQGGKRRGVAVLWWWLSGLALASFLCLTITSFFSNHETPNDVHLTSTKEKVFAKTSESQQAQNNAFSSENQAEPIAESAQQTIDQPTRSFSTMKVFNKKTKPFEEVEILPNSTPTQSSTNELEKSREQKSIVTSEEPQVISSSDSIAEPAETLLANDSDVSGEHKSERKIASKSKWSIMAYVGPGISYRTLKGQNAQGVVDHRNSHEKTTFTYDAGISGQLNLRRSSYLRFGLNYSRYAEKYEFHHNAISHTTKNTYGYGQVNLNYGERFVNFGSGELSFFGGFGAGRLLHAQSSWIDPNALVPVVHSNTQANQPFENWIFNFRFGVDYQMRFSEKLELHVIPGMEGLINSSYKKETQLNQHPYAFNLNVGISYSF